MGWELDGSNDILSVLCFASLIRVPVKTKVLFHEASWHSKIVTDRVALNNFPIISC